MFYQTFDDMARELHATAVEKGFWPEDVDDIFVTKQLMMIVSEAVEVMEAIRKNKGEDEVADEMADILIRTLDLWEGLKENGYVGSNTLQVAFNKKTDVNKTRPQKHGVKF
jgi:NTP pyrophosphatase (non-canonical NTP hydrolase)